MTEENTNPVTTDQAISVPDTINTNKQTIDTNDTSKSIPDTKIDTSNTKDTTTDTSEDIDYISKYDAKKLRSHPKVAGIIGSEIQRAIAAEKQKIDEDRNKQAAEAAQAQLRQLAQDDPDEFARRWIGQDQQNRIKQQLNTIKSSTTVELAKSLGRAVRDVPEWAELTQQDMDDLAQSLVGKSDDEALPIFQKKAIDLIATKRAEARFKKFMEKELDKERDAIRKEESAKLLRGSDAPDVARPRGEPVRVNISKLTDAEFDQYWNKIHKA